MKTGTVLLGNCSIYGRRLKTKQSSSAGRLLAKRCRWGLSGCDIIGSLSEVKKLELERMKLYNKAFKTFPNSPKQLKIIAEIDKLTKQIEKLK